MDLVVSQPFFDIFFDDYNKIMLIRWKVEILDISLVEYKTVMLEAYGYIDVLNPKFLVQDGQQAIFPMTEDSNEWIIDNISSKLFDKGLEKIAYIVPKHNSTRESLKRLVEKGKSLFPQVERKLFFDIDEAMAWIIQK